MASYPPHSTSEAEVNRLEKLIGELTIANEAMKEVLRGEGKNERGDHDSEGTAPEEGARRGGSVTRLVLLHAKARQEQ
jgi:hypothetical protein